jgi:hypothetical protein
VEGPSREGAPGVTPWRPAAGLVCEGSALGEDALGAKSCEGRASEPCASP